MSIFDRKNLGELDFVIQKGRKVLSFRPMFFDFYVGTKMTVAKNEKIG